MESLDSLEPKSFWKYFSEISKIPRCSGKEEAAAKYIISLSKKWGYPATQDKAGNLVVKKPAFPGMEDRPGVILQGHLDMVCEKNEGTAHNFDTDPIRLILEGEWVRAEDTTLGADNGIAVAAALAVLEDKNLKHGPIEALFTVNEETGLNGALKFDPGLVDGRLLINLDSEEEGAFYMGCAGAIHTEAWLKKTEEALPAGWSSAVLKVRGLRGGHSGADINRGFGNAIQIAVRVLWSVLKKTEYRLYDLHGGGKHNAIPREAFIHIAFPSENWDEILKTVNTQEKVIKEELLSLEPGFSIEISGQDKTPEKVFTADFTSAVLRTLFLTPHGVLAMSTEMPGLVETSTNLAGVDITGKGEIHILTSQRSNRNSTRDFLSDRIAALFSSAGARVIQSNTYPAWIPNPKDPFLLKCVALYKELTGREGEIKAIHAGLECGVLGDKLPGIRMVSFGPVLDGVHTPKERVKTDSVKRLWDYLIKLLETAG